jgi:hypothetical protein
MNFNSYTKYLAALLVVGIGIGLNVTALAATIRVPQDQPTITAGVAAANNGDTVLISDGTYNEHGIVITQALTLTSVNGSAVTTVNGQGLVGGGGIFTVNATNTDAVNIQGLTITGGGSSSGTTVKQISGLLEVQNCVFATNYNASIVGSQQSNTMVIDCVIRNNNAENFAGVLGAIVVGCLLVNNTGANNPCVLVNCNATNCTVYNNTGGVLGNPWTVGGMQDGTADNCIFWGNSGYTNQQVYSSTGNTLPVNYSIVQGGYSGTGNLSSNPLFVNPAAGDFFLQTNSPAKNSGDPTILNADGSRSDMGAYGGNFTQPQSFVTNGLVAYYPFNGNANDASGNGHNGTNYGGVLVPDRFSEPNQAFFFNGTNTDNSDTNSFVDLSENPPITGVQTNFSICGWINPAYISQLPHAQTIARGIYWHRANWADIGVRIANSPWVTSSMTTLEFTTISGVFSANQNDNLFASILIPTNAWTAFVATYDGLTKNLYINGSLNVSISYTFPANWNTGFMGEGIGGDFAGQAETFDGVIDDVRIYNRALSTSEVAELYAYESTTPSTTPPSITSQPQPVTVNAFNNASFNVTASGTMPLSYQWSFNGTNISGATASSLTVSNVTPQALGAYAVVVSNASGTITSSNAILSMYPFLATPFDGDVLDWGQNATLSVQAWGTGPLTFQWYDNGVAVLNASNQTLDLSNIQFTNAGLYSVVVSGPLGSVTNTAAQVVVNVAGVSLGFSPTLTIVGVPGFTYVVQSTTNLKNTNSWITLTNMTLTQPIQLFIDTTINASSPFNPQHFYRVLPGQ